jgi:uncharacterized OB-fold protein
MISPVKIWRHQKKIAQLLGKEGKIISWTVIYVPPVGYESEAPYPVVLVELESGGRMVGQLVDWQRKNLRVGQKVRAVYRRIRSPDLEGVIPYGIKFTPIG